MEHYGLSVSSFADAIGVQRSSISHVVGGRNKPSLDFVMKVVKTYPEVNLYWLLMGKGSFPAPSSKTAAPESKVENPSLTSAPTLPEPVRMVVFYTDGTFESFDAKKSK